MKLSRAARFGDTVTASDAYNPAVTMRVQLAPLDLFKIDGTAVKRRQLSCAPEVTMPARGVIDIDGQKYVVGDESADFWKGERIRNNYVMQGADYMANMLDIAGALSNLTPATAWASLDFNKYSTDSRESAEYQAQYMIFLSDSENPTDLMQLGGTWYLVKQYYRSVSGLLSVLANELTGNVFETINYTSKTYNPITDTYTDATTSVKVMRVRWTEHFQYLSKASEPYERGDQQVFVLKSALTPKASDVLPLSDGNWRVLSVMDEGLTWSLHVRR